MQHAQFLSINRHAYIPSTPLLSQACPPRPQNDARSDTKRRPSSCRKRRQTVASSKPPTQETPSPATTTIAITARISNAMTRLPLQRLKTDAP
jgi:hypothetical protein